MEDEMIGWHHQLNPTAWQDEALARDGEEMATHSSVLAQRIPGTEEPGRLPSMGSYRVGHD